MTRWQLGEPDRARELIDQANRRARDLGHAPVDGPSSELEIPSLKSCAASAAAALSAAETLRASALEHGMPYWRVKAELDAQWARGRLHDAAAGVEGLRRALAAAADQGMDGGRLFLRCCSPSWRRRRWARTPRSSESTKRWFLAHQVDDRCDLAFPHLLRGELLLEARSVEHRLSGGSLPDCPCHREKAVPRSLGLRASLSLAKLFQSTGRPADAHAALAPALEGFSPTSEMPGFCRAAGAAGDTR